MHARPTRRMSLTAIAFVGAVAGATALSPAPADGQVRVRVNVRDQVQHNAFTWSGELAAGRRVIVRNLTGSISVEPGRSRTMEVVATKRWRRGAPADVAIDATRAGQNVVVCARWSANTECTENTYRVRGNRGRHDNNDTQVDFVIRLPAGAHAVLNTLQGNIEVTGASGAVSANTTNGNISVETSDGPVEANTTNGNIDVSLPRIPSDGATYGTVNGNITVSIPDGADADLEASTMHGRIDSDFPVAVTGSIGPRRLRGTIGRGGATLRLSTINGRIRIEKR